MTGEEVMTTDVGATMTGVGVSTIDEGVPTGMMTGAGVTEGMRVTGDMRGDMEIGENMATDHMAAGAYGIHT